MQQRAGRAERGPTSTRNPRTSKSSTPASKLRAAGHHRSPGQAEADRRALRQVLPQRLPPHDRAAGHRLHAGRDRRFHHPLGQRRAAGASSARPSAREGVHIIDPFTGTGTFITRLLQSGLIAPEELEHKYRHEIHANEIVLLAYYIAAINIEAVYHGRWPRRRLRALRGHLPDRHLPDVREATT